MSLQELAQAAGLSAEDRDLLELLLAEKGVELDEIDVIKPQERSGDPHGHPATSVSPGMRQS